MSAVNGKLYVVKDGANVIGASREASISFSKNTATVHTKSTADDFARRLELDKDWEISFSGLYDPSETYNLPELYTWLDSGGSKTVYFEPDTPASGQIRFQLTGILTSLELTANQHEEMGISGSVECDGPPIVTVEP